MYVWEQLHVQGRRIPGRARRRKKLQIRTLLKTNTFIYCKFQDFFFDDLVESTLFGWWKTKKKKRD
jgi:hypothetical protein